MTSSRQTEFCSCLLEAHGSQRRGDAMRRLVISLVYLDLKPPLSRGLLESFDPGWRVLRGLSTPQPTELRTMSSYSTAVRSGTAFLLQELDDSTPPLRAYFEARLCTLPGPRFSELQFKML